MMQKMKGLYERDVVESEGRWGVSTIGDEADCAKDLLSNDSGVQTTQSKLLKDSRRLCKLNLR